MSRKVDASDLSVLSQEDLEYLQVRGSLTAEQEEELIGEQEEQDPPTLDDVPYYGDENTVPSVQTEDGSPTLDPDDYADASNERLREELRRRGMSTTGNKEVLIERLEYADAEEEEEE